MSEYNAPRRGSLSYYPRVRAAKQTPSLKGYAKVGEAAKPLNFLCYKVGMVQVQGKNVHKASPTFNQEVVAPATVVECPPLKVFGVRAYEKAEIGYSVLSDVTSDNTDKELKRTMLNFKQPQNKETKKEEAKDDSYTLDDFEKEIADIEYFTLLVYTSPSFKKTPAVSEIFIGGTKEQQLAYAKEKLGKEVSIEEAFKEGEFLDVRAVTKGKGFQGPVKRFHVRSLRPKHKKQRVVGSIGPWHPNTVMFSVARPGQMGYHNRTESNKKILKISKNVAEINTSSGFLNYGNVEGAYALIFGSLPGPAKRCIALRSCIRPAQQVGVQLQTVERVLGKN